MRTIIYWFLKIFCCVQKYQPTSFFSLTKVLFYWLSSDFLQIPVLMVPLCSFWNQQFSNIFSKTNIYLKRLIWEMLNSLQSWVFQGNWRVVPFSAFPCSHWWLVGCPLRLGWQRCCASLRWCCQSHMCSDPCPIGTIPWRTPSVPAMVWLLTRSSWIKRNTSYKGEYWTCISL